MNTVALQDLLNDLENITEHIDEESTAVAGNVSTKGIDALRALLKEQELKETT